MLNGQPIESGGGLNGGLNTSQRNTMQYIKEHPGCTAHSISSELGLSVDTIDKHIRVLVGGGYVERRGSKRTGGYYIK